MLILSHPTGNANSRQNALALLEAGLLAEFWTCLNWEPGAPLRALLPDSFRRTLDRRSFDELDGALIRSHPWREVGRHLASRLGVRSWYGDQDAPFSVDAVYRSLDRRVAGRLGQIRGLTGVFASEDGAQVSFEAARQAGLKCIYELPIGYWRAARELLVEEAQLNPAWASTIPGNRDRAAKLERKDRELAGADHILVASSYTRATLEQAPGRLATISVIPYGAPPALVELPVNGSKSSRLKVIYVGALTQRKGISYFFDAVHRLREHVEVTVIGALPSTGCPALEAAISQHRWIPTAPRERVLEELAQQDVLVLPSLFEGFGLVILEALSQGVPVIATRHTGAPDVLTDGEDGYLVPIRSSQAIQEKLGILLRSPDTVRSMKEAAWRKARTLPWAAYRGRVTEMVRKTICSAPADLVRD